MEQWNYFELKKLEHLLKHDKNKDLQDTIKETKDTVQELEFFSLFHRFPSLKVHQEEKFQIHEYIPKDILKNILNASFCFSKIEDNTDNPIYPKLTKPLLEETKNFLLYLNDKDMIRFYQKYYYHQGLLDYTYLQNETYSGITRSIYYPIYLPFISINKTQTYEDMVTLNHELSHAFYFQYDAINSKRSVFLRELEGKFFDYLSIDYLYNQKIITKKEKELLLLDWLSIEIQRFYEFFMFHCAYISYKNTHHVNFNYCVRKGMEKELKWDENAFFSIIPYTDSYQIAIYLFSFFTCLDLLEILKKDKEYAMYLLKEIRKNKNNIYQNLESHEIHFFEDHYKTLKKALQSFPTK